ncbi:hypothetical protein C3K47_00195 [Solitalea longa]|uniref:Carbohydrate-binding domain-containing protein n=1 Tax=Solitalea longa TaxID=2079460 RepID=A0A2S5A9I4_9SPHI|nr:carbohydrate-binding family 9-like protein [Solitalea longa]POY38959.1 hypothetical protein C3K47_00195 [Solitalea longa]
MSISKTFIFSLCLFCSFCASPEVTTPQSIKSSDPAFYSCKKTTGVITIDGMQNDTDWDKAEWSDYFTDIEGPKQPAPFNRTRIKMLWNNSGMYVFAELDEPQLQASITQRDAVIFHDNDFEVFIDPDNDGLNYYEIEVNALNTIWDLMLNKAYSKGGRANNSWTATGLKTAVALNGTLNDPSDIDKGWSVELFIPWTAFKENRVPQLGESWKMNFSRVQWRFDANQGVYVKRIDPKTGNPLSEYNWVWSPMGAINMHIPELWKPVKFEN